MLARLLLTWLLAAALPAVLLPISSASAADEDSAQSSEEEEGEDAHEGAGHEEEGHDHDDADHDDAHHGEEHGAGHGGGGHGGGGSPDPLATDPDLAIWTLVVFVAMLAILKQVAWKPIMDALAMREATISGHYQAAEEKHDEAKRLLEKHQAELATTADQVKELLDEARRDAEHTKAEIVAEAKAAADAERERAVRDIEQAKDVVVRDLAERTAGLAIDLAGKVVQKDITPERQKEIVGDALGRFASNEPSAN